MTAAAALPEANEFERQHHRDVRRCRCHLRRRFHRALMSGRAVVEIARAPLTVSDLKGCTWSRINTSSQTCKCSVRCPHGAFSAIRSLKMPNGIVMVGKKRKQVLNKAAA